MSRKKHPDSKKWPAKKQASSPAENYGTQERPSHPRGAERMNEDFAKAGADQDILREAERAAEGRQDESGR